jgi:hypothetical protein
MSAGSGPRIAALRTQSRARAKVADHVCAALPPLLARAVVSAGIDEGRLTIGVAGGAWAARLRYGTDSLRIRVGESLGIDIQSIRIKVVPPGA